MFLQHQDSVNPFVCHLEIKDVFSHRQSNSWNSLMHLFVRDFPKSPKLICYLICQILLSK